MKKIIALSAVIISVFISACSSNNKPASQTAAATENAATAPASVDKAKLYGKWKFDKSSITIADTDGKIVMNDTIQGGEDDYFIFKEDGTAISHINAQMQGNEKFKFINDNELVNANSNERATIKINSVTDEDCELYFNQNKPDGSIKMFMFLKKKE